MKPTMNEDLALISSVEHTFADLRYFDDERKWRRGLIETERAALGISQREMAKRMEITEQAYQRMRKRLKESDAKAKISTLVKAAAAMDCRVIVVVMPIDQVPFGELASEEAAKRAKRAKENLEFCKKAGRDHGRRRH